MIIMIEIDVEIVKEMGVMVFFGEKYGKVVCVV